MTTHLSPEQFVEAAEGTLAPTERRHLESCEACAREVTQLSALMGDVHATLDMPEPSPLFWEHFSRRVRAATEAESIPANAWWHDAWRPLATLAAMAAVVLIIVELKHPRQPVAPSVATVADAQAAAPVETELAEVGLGEPVQDPAMDFVTQLASDVPWDDLKEVAQPSRDVTAAAVGQLTAAQKAELTRLVKAAMDGAE